MKQNIKKRILNNCPILQVLVLVKKKMMIKNHFLIVTLIHNHLQILNLIQILPVHPHHPQIHKIVN
jgi:hypothetical protein